MCSWSYGALYMKLGLFMNDQELRWFKNQLSQQH